LNQIFALHEKEKDEKETEKIIGNLYEYIKGHFRKEEEYMLKHNYAGYDKQKQEHNRFIDSFSEFQREFLKGHRLTAINLFNFVWDWFSQHIVKLDRLYSSFLKEKI
jgi:hemerythrin